MSTQSHRAVEKQAASFRLEEINRFSNQHGAMGRAHAPQRRSHHHRPVISFKDPPGAWYFVLCSLSSFCRGTSFHRDVKDYSIHKVQSTKYKAPSTKRKALNP